jgi:predicted RNA binding protein YcfA (HicA-like mRNA interferase family)
MKVRDIIKLIQEDGWYHVGTRGGHRQFKHPMKAGKVTVAGHPSDELHPKTVKSILEQAQMEV